MEGFLGSLLAFAEVPQVAWVDKGSLEVPLENPT